MAKDSFEKIFTRPELLDFLKEMNFSSPTPVQKQVPAHFGSEDLSVLAPTGSGKTLSYLMPLFDELKTRETAQGATQKVAAPLAIILSPTRELSRQITEVCKALGHHLKLRVRHLAFAEGARKESMLFKGAFDILIAGPSKLNMAIEQKKLHLDQLKYLILDEADQMLDMGFSKDLQKLCTHFNQKDLPRIHLFSATAPVDFAEKRDLIFQREFKTIAIEKSHHLSAKVETFNIYLSVKEKRPMLETFLQKEARGAGVIFVNDKQVAENIYNELKEKIKRPKLLLLHGQMTPKERKEAHLQFKESQSVLIATDIVARGIDLPELAWILNYDLPYDAVYYIHRSGRVGRRGGSGLVYNFVTGHDIEVIEKINLAIQSQTALALKPLKAIKKKVATKKVSAPPASKAKNEAPYQGARKKVARAKKTPRYKRKA